MMTDITRGRLLRLPRDYRLLNLKPDGTWSRTLCGRRARSPSTSTPSPSATVDRTDGEQPRWPTLGVKIVPELPAGTAQLFPDIAMLAAPALHVTPVRLAERVIATAIVGSDQSYLERPCVRRRASQVDTSAVGITEFDAPKEKRDAVAAEGTRPPLGS